MLNTCASKFAKFLEAKNLNFRSGTDSDGDSVIEFPYQGKVTKIFFTGKEGTYLCMYLFFDLVHSKKVTDLIIVCN